MHNKKALKQIVQAMAEHGVGYGSINHPVDRCKCCSYHGLLEMNVRAAEMKMRLI